MSNLRLIGLFVGLFGLIITFNVYRGSRWKRANFLFFSLFNFGLIVVSIEPDTVNFISEALSLESHQHGRLIGLLVLAVLFLLFLSFYTKSRVEILRLQVDKLIRSLTVNFLNVDADYKDKIKPLMILMPAYNEAENLRILLPKIPEMVNGLMLGTLVVDDGSTDGTFSIASKTGALVIKNPINRGGGAALRLGYDILKKSGTQICITMDADCQHEPAQIEKLVEPVLNDHYDMVIGSRVIGSIEKDNRLRLIGVHLFGRLISLLLGEKITDPSSGFRAFKMGSLGSINLYEDQYHTSELIVEAVRKGLRIGEVPITIRKRKYGKSKKGKDWLYGLRFAKTIIKTWWRPK